MTKPDTATAANTEILGVNALRWLLLSLVVIFVDQYTKFLITENLTLYQRIDVWPVFSIVRLHNTGAAFSFLAGASGWQNWLFVGIAAVVSAGVLWWLATLPKTGRRVLALGLVLVLGGAIGNVIDRLALGYVVDFLLFRWREWSYPAFNVADSAITCGVALILYDGLILEKRRSADSQAPD